MNFRTWMESTQFRYIGQCDKLRRATPEGEHNWQVMTATAKPVSPEELLSHVDMKPILDDDETVEEWLSGATDAKFYFSSWGGQPAYYIETSGFEFVFVKN